MPSSLSWRRGNENPRRYVWKAKGEDILRKINAARQALAASQALLAKWRLPTPSSPISAINGFSPGRAWETLRAKGAQPAATALGKHRNQES
jgi:hypothetical protein